MTHKFGCRWSIANFMLKNRDRSLKFLEKFWRPFTSFDTQIWWSISNLVLKNGDRSLKFLETFWRPFTSFDTQIWWSMIDRGFRAKTGDQSLIFLEKFWRPFTSFDTQIWLSLIDRKFDVKKWWSIAEVYGKILKTIYKFWHTNSVIDRKFGVEK